MLFAFRCTLSLYSPTFCILFYYLTILNLHNFIYLPWTIVLKCCSCCSVPVSQWEGGDRQCATCAVSECQSCQPQLECGKGKCQPKTQQYNTINIKKYNQFYWYNTVQQQQQQQQQQHNAQLVSIITTTTTIQQISNCWSALHTVPASFPWRSIAFAKFSPLEKTLLHLPEPPLLSTRWHTVSRSELLVFSDSLIRSSSKTLSSLRYFKSGHSRILSLKSLSSIFLKIGTISPSPLTPIHPLISIILIPIIATL